MKIGLVCPYKYGKSGGVMEVVLATHAELRRRKHDAYIITPRPQGYQGDPPDHVIFVGTSTDFNSPLHTTVQVAASTNDEIDAVLEVGQFDVLHFHEPWVPMLGLRMLARSKTVNVATFHAALPDTIMTNSLIRMVTPYTKAALKYIDAFIATSGASAQYVSSLTDEPIMIVPLAVDTGKYKAPKKRDDKRTHKTIFNVGRLEGRKGTKYLIKAFAVLQASHPETSLIIASDGPDRAKLEMLVDDLGLKNVSFLGYISDEDKIKLMQECDLFCAPSIFGEGFGLVLVEAMSCGAVVVAGDNPGYASVLKDMGLISLVNPKHSADFARRLELMLYAQDLCKLWRNWAKNELPKYTYKRITDQYLQIYEQTIAQHKSRSYE